MSATPTPPTGLGTRLARNSLHSASGRIVAMVAWLALTPPLVRALGPEGFGVWSLFYAIAGWLWSMDLGFAQVALRFGAAARAREALDEAGEYATLALLGYLTLGAVLFVLLFLVHQPVLDLLHIQGQARPLAAVAFLTAPGVFVLGGLTITCTALLQAWDRFDLANAVNLTVSLAQVALLSLVLATGGGFLRCLGAFTAAWVVAMVVGLLLLPRGVPGFRWAPPAAALGRLRQAAAFGLPLQLANGLAVAHQQLGKVLLVRGVSLATAGSYELGLRVSTAAFTFVQLVLVAMIPEASVLHERDERARLQALHQRGGRVVTAAAALVTAVLVAVAPAVLPLWIGRPDPAAELALRGLALAGFAGVAGGVTSVIARGVGRPRFEMEWSGLALLVHATLAVLLIPVQGLLGALVAVAAGNALSALWFAWRLGRALGWPVGRMLWDPFVVPVLAIVAGAFAGDRLGSALAAPWLSLVAAAAAAGVVALALLLAFRHVRWQEITSLARRGVAR